MTMTDGGPHAVQTLRGRLAAAGIATEDWDPLFRAALELLARVALEKAVPEGAAVRLQAPGTALRECMDALDRLRRSVPPPRAQQGRKPDGAAGETPAVVPAPAPGSDR